MEEWRDIPGYEGYYQASSIGRIRSVDRIVDAPKQFGGTRKSSSIILKQQKRKNNRMQVCLSIGNVHVTKSVHRLVASAFIPNPDNKPEVNHIDGNPTNNAITNLEWVTKSENIRHSYDVLHREPNRPWRRKKSPRRKLTEEQVLEIRSDNVSTYKQLSERFGVAISTIGRVKNNEYYRLIG